MWGLKYICFKECIIQNWEHSTILYLFSLMDSYRLLAFQATYLWGVGLFSLVTNKGIPECLALDNTIVKCNLSHHTIQRLFLLKERFNISENVCKSFNFQRIWDE